LRQTDQVPDRDRHAVGSGKQLWSGTSEGAEKDGTPMIEKRQRAGDSNDQERRVDLRWRWHVHRSL
jgi:hypothetical protein